MNKQDKEILESTLDFFKTAFCVEQASLATDKEKSNLTCGCVIKMTTNDKRGTFYIAQMLENE